MRFGERSLNRWELIVGFGGGLHGTFTANARLNGNVCKTNCIIEEITQGKQRV